MSEHRRSHHHRHHHSHRSWFHIPSFHGQKKIHKKDLIKGTVLIGVILTAAFTAAMYINRWEQNEYATPEVVLEHQTIHADSPPKAVMADGVRYDLYTNLDAYLFIGVDVDGRVADMNPMDGGGQGDVQMLLVLNHENETWQILQMNRDSMVRVPILGLTGKVIGHSTMQLALAHSYGTGVEDSCRNNVTAVSELLGNQFIRGYIALNMDGIAPINDALGGVEVTIFPEYGLDASSFEPNSQVLLTGDQAVFFLRGRQGVGDETNLSRMSRQRQYIEALTRKVQEMDIGALISAYEAAGEYRVTNMNTAAITEIARKLQSYQQLELLTIQGTDTVADNHTAYILDDASVQNIILQLFYHK